MVKHSCHDSQVNIKQSRTRITRMMGDCVRQEKFLPPGFPCNLEKVSKSEQKEELCKADLILLTPHHPGFLFILMNISLILIAFCISSDESRKFVNVTLSSLCVSDRLKNDSHF